MGANRRNKLGQSRRFAPCYILALPNRQNNEMLKYHDTDLYLTLLAKYQETKTNSQNGKLGHDAHILSIKNIKQYLRVVNHHYIKHN